MGEWSKSDFWATRALLFQDDLASIWTVYSLVLNLISHHSCLSHSCFCVQSFQWMSRVLQAVDSIHQVGLYCLALVPPNYLPKTPLGGIHLSECKRRFLEGTLHPANVLLCPHTCVTNLPKPREVHSGTELFVWQLALLTPTQFCTRCFIKTQLNDHINK